MRKHILQILVFVFASCPIVGLAQAPKDVVVISNEVRRRLHVPSSSGDRVGFASRRIKGGDIIVIPERVPHGFASVPDHVTYLSVRPDLKKVLHHGYLNPTLTKK